MSRPYTNALMNSMNHKRYVNLSIQWNRWLMTPMGLWPRSPNISKLEKSFYCLLHAVCYSLLSFIFIPCGLYVILEVEDVYNKLKLFGPLCFCLMAYGKYYSLISHSRDIRECIKRIEWDWRNVTHAEDREIMVTNAHFGRRLAMCCMLFMYGCFVFYYIAVPISMGRVVAEDENFTFVPMVFPFSKYIIDTRHSPINEVFFSIQLCSGMLINGITAVACSLAAVLAVHACGQMEVLICWLDHLTDGREDMSKTVHERIARIVSHHVRILKFLTLTEKALRQVSLVEFLGCTVDLCLLGYYIIVEWSSKEMTAVVTYALLLVSLTMNIFIFCYIGELVAERCRKVGEMSYMIDWYRLPGKEKLGLVLVMAMANSSINLTAGNIIKLSFSSFNDVVRTAVAFLNMLRTLT